MARNLLGVCSFVALVASANVAFAVDESETSKTISLVAINTGTAAVALSSPSASIACFFSLITFDPTTPIGRVFYATLLDAKALGRTVDIAYSREGAACTLKQVTAR